MSSIFRKAKNYTSKSLTNSVYNAVDGGLERLPKVAFLSPILNKAAIQIKQQASKKLLNTATNTDVLIIGAGISGILMAAKLKKSRKLDRMIIIEKRQDIGGTWDIFNYPGVRSDSDISTFCFADRPWLGKDSLAAGKDIKDYLKAAVKEDDIKKNICFGKLVTSMHWSSTDKFWTVTIQNIATKKIEVITAKFVVCASGYYNTEQGYQPEFQNQHSFTGKIVHPQQWQKNLNYQDKKIVIIGSGATAVTLLPSLLDKNLEQQAKHVTMLQRSPTYIVSVPESSNFVEKLTADWQFISTEHAYQINRWRNILTQQLSYKLLKKQPKLGKLVLKYATRQQLKGTEVSLKHFLPTYNPWEQRVCAVPKGNFFKALRSGKASVVTDEISQFTETGIQLSSGSHLKADIIVTATGLNIEMLGGAKVYIDNKEVTSGNSITYKAVMLESIPNLAVMFGYTNASWTLKSDIACSYVIRLLNYMERYDYNTVVAKAKNKESMIRRDCTVMDALESGYVKRGAHLLPKQGREYPWYVTNNYMSDRKVLLYKKINDKWLKFSK